MISDGFSFSRRRRYQSRLQPSAKTLICPSTEFHPERGQVRARRLDEWARVMGLSPLIRPFWEAYLPRRHAPPGSAVYQTLIPALLWKLAPRASSYSPG